ncbi:MAG: substrate-binding domain-containing protein, partial [Candidatus Omnitrophica bacterium]|nr:substrate-binding domain-containing protein [Candidatus Omnitrophota bacterium]
TPARIAARKLLRLKNRPTAIFAASDVMALEVMDAVRALGIRVPEELSVVGFDNNPLSTTGLVKLTTVSQPLVEMGRLGAESLYQISRGKMKLPLKVVLPTKLIKRQSVSTVAGAGRRPAKVK